MDGRVAWLMLLGIATTLDGLLAGASVDQSVEQLPARHRIGMRAYHAYTQASHMANGRFWLIPLGIGAPLLRIGAAAWAHSMNPATVRIGPVYLAALLAVAHMLSTLKVGRINWTLGPWQPPERRITVRGGRLGTGSERAMIQTQAMHMIPRWDRPAIGRKSELSRGHIKRFTIDSLMNMVAHGALEVRISLRRRPVTAA